MNHNARPNGSVKNVNGNLEEKLDELCQLMGKEDGDPSNCWCWSWGMDKSIHYYIAGGLYGGLREKGYDKNKEKTWKNS